MALFHLEEYESAAKAFGSLQAELAKQPSPSLDKQLKVWREKCEKAIASKSGALHVSKFSVFLWVELLA